MKKKVLTALFCMFSLALLLACKPITIHACAANDLEVTIQEVETPTTISGVSIYTGDLKVTISISNNIGFAEMSFRFPFDTSSLTGISVSNSPSVALVIPGSIISGASCVCIFNHNDPTVGLGISISSFDNISSDGDLLSFFLRPNPNVSIEPEDIIELISPIDMESIIDEDDQDAPYTIPEEFEYTVAIPYSFYLGDIDGTVSNNGYRIGLLDVQKLLQMINSYDGTLYVTATDTNFSQTDYPGLYVMINNVPTLELRVADVNFDGIIDSTDHALLLDYYVDCIIGLEPEGEIGQLQTHVTYVVQYSTGS